MIKVTDFEYFIFIAFTLKFDVKSLLSEGVGMSQGIREPLFTCSSYLELCSECLIKVFDNNLEIIILISP